MESKNLHFANELSTLMSSKNSDEFKDDASGIAISAGLQQIGVPGPIAKPIGEALGPKAHDVISKFVAEFGESLEDIEDGRIKKFWEAIKP